jgi:hypothetical protein
MLQLAWTDEIKWVNVVRRRTGLVAQASGCLMLLF